VSYRCNVCESKVPAGSAMLKHVVYRPDRSILREIPVCPGCQTVLAAGATPPVRRSPKVFVPVERPAPVPAALAATRVRLGRSQETY